MQIFLHEIWNTKIQNDRLPPVKVTAPHEGFCFNQKSKTQIKIKNFITKISYTHLHFTV